MLNIMITKLKAAPMARRGTLRALRVRRAARPASAQIGSITAYAAP
jgi:hypothetical protein